MKHLPWILWSLLGVYTLLVVGDREAGLLCLILAKLWEPRP